MAFLVAGGALDACGFLGWLPKDLVHSISLLQSSFPGEPGLNPDTGSAVLPLLGMASELGCKAEVGRDGGPFLNTPLPSSSSHPLLHLLTLLHHSYIHTCLPCTRLHVLL